MFDLIFSVTSIALLLLTPSFIINVIILLVVLLIPKMRNFINLSFIYGAICGVMVGGFFGLGLIFNRFYVNIIFIYIIGVIDSLYIMIPFLLVYFLNKIENRLNGKSKFFYGFCIFFMEILLTFIFIKWIDS